MWTSLERKPSSQVLSFNSKSPKEISQSRPGALFSFTGPDFKETKFPANWAPKNPSGQESDTRPASSLLVLWDVGLLGSGKITAGSDLVEDKCCSDCEKMPHWKFSSTRGKQGDGRLSV